MIFSPLWLEKQMGHSGVRLIKEFHCSYIPKSGGVPQAKVIKKRRRRSYRFLVVENERRLLFFLRDLVIVDGGGPLNPKLADWPIESS